MWFNLKGSIKAIAAAAGVKVGSPLAAIWTFPSVIFTSMLIAWAAEASQYLISQGMAVAAGVERW